MMTVRQFLEHSDPQQRFVIYPGNAGLEDSGKAKDLLKDCWYLDNEVREFFVCAIEKNTIGVRCRQPIGIDKYEKVQPAGLPHVVLDMIGKMHTYKNEHRDAHSVLDMIKEKYDITISLTRKL